MSVGLQEVMEYWTITDLLDTVDALEFRRELDDLAGPEVK